MNEQLVAPVEPTRTVAVPRQETRRQDTNTLTRMRDLSTSLMLVCLLPGLFVAGRLLWDDRYYVAEEGIGYGMGLVGGIFMLVALAYALIKRQKAFRAKGYLRHTLKVHILFGVLGPVLVLLHSTFQIGSVNGAAALISMTLVYFSGVVGRYLYAKVHSGLCSRKNSIVELNSQRADSVENDILHYVPEWLPAIATARSHSIWHACWRLFAFRWQVFKAWRETRRNLLAAGGPDRYSAMKQNKRAFYRYSASLQKVALLSVYERFFFIWRHAHVPLLCLLLISGVAHVVAVHMY